MNNSKCSNQVTKESQYNFLLDIEQEHGLNSLGIMANGRWREDPKTLLFSLARYKFVAKMLEGCDKVLEVGCADAFGTRLVQQTVNQVTAIDFDPVFIKDILIRSDSKWPLIAFEHDILEGPLQEKFDAIYSLDVLEHIDTNKEIVFLDNTCKSLVDNGVLILGMPSLESQKYASIPSKLGHINCKTGNDFKNLLNHFFYNVFLFSMNDEVVHTGFSKMAYYLIVLCCGKKLEKN